VILSFITPNLTIEPQQVITDPKIIAKCFGVQNRDMQKFSLNLDDFKFEVELELEPINCKNITLATEPYARVRKPHVMVFILLVSMG
jgi:hypothetical protein